MLSEWAQVWVWAWVVLLSSPCTSMATQRLQGDSEEPGMRHIMDAINRVSQALETQERHTRLYERVALLETSLAEKTEQEMTLQAEVTQLRAKIPELEAEIKTIPDMRKELGEFEAKIEKLVQDYEAKLSTLASEVIRLKKTGARRKELLTLSDGASSCPEVGQGMVAERIGEHCLYFSSVKRLNWTASHHHCQQLGAHMAASHNLQPLNQFLRQAFASRGPSLWLGSSFNPSDEESHEEKDENEVAAGDVIREEETSTAASGLEMTSRIPRGQDLSNLLQSDGVIEISEGEVQELFNLTNLKLKNIPLDEMEGEVIVSGGAGSFKGILDNVPMFQDSPLASYGSHVIENEATAKAPAEEEENGKVSEDSVVDIVLLTGKDETQERLDTETQDPANQTETDNVEAAVAMVPEGLNVEDALNSVQEAWKTGQPTKTRMKCKLLQQSESMEYEVVGRPCDELHSFICDIRVTIDTLLPEW